MIISGDLWALHIGDVCGVLRSLPAESVHCCVTSPPYWGLRDYGLPPSVWGDGWQGCFGLEPTIESYVVHTLEICREIRRVLRDDGVLWWNLGDSYASEKAGTSMPAQTVAGGVGGIGDEAAHRGMGDAGTARRRTSSIGLKSGGQCLIPFRVALALQADGWWVRSTVVWQKKSPMPESLSGWRWVRCRVKVANAPRRFKGHVREQGDYAEDGKSFATGADWSPCPGCPKCSPNNGYVLRKGRWRCTNAWEPIFQLAKSPEYFCDAEGVKEKAIGGQPGNNSHKGADGYQQGDKHLRTKVGLTEMVASETRNPRNVWSISSEPLKAAHFAAFPSSIPRRCIQASTSAAGCCPDCGSQWAPIVETERVATRPGLNPKEWKHDGADALTIRSDVSPNRDPERHIQRTKVLGYQQTCGCPQHEPVPCTVLDPFAGSGTTLMVARWLKRKSIGIELSEKYATEIAAQRIETPEPTKKNKRPKRKRNVRERLLF
jgi:DNA modification methylase